MRPDDCSQTILDDAMVAPPITINKARLVEQHMTDAAIRLALRK